jgi:nucleoside phosphorylase
MEAAAVLRICAAYRVPCLAPKAVCDTADSGIRGFWTEFDNVMQRLAVYVAGLIEILTRQGY